MQTTVSVIIPAFNAEKYIRETLLSAIQQSFTDIEIIVVNDGSTDQTAEIITAFLSDKRVRAIHASNSGVSHARNTGLKTATGKYVAFLDADDVWLRDNLEEKVTFLENNSQYSMVHSDAEEIDENGIPTGKKYTGENGFLLKDLLLWEKTCVPGPSSILVRTDIARELNGFDESLSTAADQDFFIRISAKYAIGRIAKCLLQYRLHPGNMHKNIRLMEKDHTHVYKKAAHNKLYPSLWFRLRCFSNLYHTLAGSWWIQGKNMPRGVYCFFLGIVLYPPSLFRFIKKLAHA